MRAQQCLYLLGAALVWLAVVLPAGGLRRPAAQFSAALAVGAYGLLSGHYLASSLLVGPELLASFALLLGLACVIGCWSDRQRVPWVGVTLAAGAATSAALSAGMKPALLGSAALITGLAVLSVVREGGLRRPVRLSIALLLLVPTAAVVQTDRLLAARYADVQTVTSPVSAFCNNADLVADALAEHDSRAGALLGAAGRADFQAFLAQAMPRADWPLLGFVGDACVYDLLVARETLERRYFGDTAELVAAGYRRLLTASVLDEPSRFGGRVWRQVQAMLFTHTPLDCTCPLLDRPPTPTQQATSPPPIRQLLADSQSTAAQGWLQTLWVTDVWCARALPALHAVHLPLATGLVLALLVLWIQRRRIPASLWRVLLLTGIAALGWLSTGAAVALVHTFDVTRYLTVGFPLYVLLLALLLRALLEVLGALLGPPARREPAERSLHPSQGPKAP